MNEFDWEYSEYCVDELQTLPNMKHNASCAYETVGSRQRQMKSSSCLLWQWQSTAPCGRYMSQFALYPHGTRVKSFQTKSLLSHFSCTPTHAAFPHFHLKSCREKDAGLYVKRLKASRAADHYTATTTNTGRLSNDTFQTRAVTFPPHCALLSHFVLISKANWKCV